jgi:uridine monophosphate synthetase
MQESDSCPAMGSSRSVNHATRSTSFADRASLPGTSPLGMFLFSLMARKKSNLCLSADVQTSSELLELAEECGDSICMLKTHADIVYDFNKDTIKALTEIATRKHFVIFEDRKFGDIGSKLSMLSTT